MTKIYQSANIGPQPGEPLCDGTEEVIEPGNNGEKINVEKWSKQQKELKTRADEASLRAYTRR